MRAVVIGSGVGGLSAAIRLSAMGLEVLVLEKLGGPGGRASVHQAQGFTFDMGPTVITVPPFLEDLFATKPGDPRLYPDFPQEEGLAHTERYVKLVPLDPFYRLHFPDGTHFDYKDDPEHLQREIARLAPEDLEGYRRFEAHARALFQKGFLELGFTHFGSLLDLLKVAPDLSFEALDQVVELCRKHGLEGLVAVNTTLERPGLKSPLAEEAGGLSGRPLKGRSLEVLRYLAGVKDLTLVSVGGVESPMDVWERLKLGARLVQVYTGFVYGGPLFPRRTLKGLLRLMEAEGVRSLTELWVSIP